MSKGMWSRVKICIVFLVFNFRLWGIYSGTVHDLYTQKPVEGVLIQLKGTDISAVSNQFGEFILGISNDSLGSGEIKVVGQTIFWSLPSSGNLIICNTSGQTISKIKLNVGEGQANIDYLDRGIYIFRAQLLDKKVFTAKFLYSGNSNSGTLNLSLAMSIKTTGSSDTLVFSKEGYYMQLYPLDNNYNVYDIFKTHYDVSIEWLSRLIRPEAFKSLEGEPLSPIFSEISSVKFVYSFDDDKIYYINSSLYSIHYEFARDILGYPKGHAIFNLEQYSNNPNRLYYLGTLNHFASSDIYTLDLWAGDEMTCEQIEKLYNKVVATTYVGNKLKFYSNSSKWSNCTSVPQIFSDELFAGQNYQPLNPAEAYGYLKKLTLDELKTEYIGHRDIVVLNGIPNDISAVAGIITADFQTPLSHINVLSHNREAPNMALRDGWTNPQIANLVNKLIYLKVTLDTFIIREATLSEAQNFWELKEPSVITRLKHDTITQGLINLESATIESDTLIGGKASNFSELLKIEVSGDQPLPLPEGAFAIPFYYYWQHMHQNLLDVYVKQMLSNPEFKTNYEFRKSKLTELQNAIVSCPISPALLTLVEDKINSSGNFSNYRFRSSTNSEDIKGFNGAGLYDSYTGIPGDTDKTIEKAIKKVWASLWNIGAFEERDYFKIDQQSVAMAVLVHRSFPDVAANGVVITENFYNEFNPGFVINVQQGDLSITNPVGGYVPDQIIWYQYESTIEYINHSTAPGMEGKTVLSDQEIQLLAKYCMAIHNHYCMLNSECLPVDIEFKVDWVERLRKIYIKQARLY
jgi:pyruvate,water dikinase